MNQLNYKKYNTIIGFEYEFYTTMKLRNLIASLKRALNLKIVFVENSKTILYSDILKNKNAVLTNDISGGIEMYELITQPLSYFKSKEILKNMNSWIDNFGLTTKYSGMHINISLKDKSIKNLDIFKFILSFAEELVWQQFPKRKGNIYCSSIKSIYPKNLYTEFIPEYKFNYIYPITKYFGVNFTKLANNYLEYRYIGGKNYHKKTTEIILLLDYFIEHLNDVINNPKLTINDKMEFNKLILPAKNFKLKLLNYNIFKEKMPNVNLTIDFKNDPLVIKTFWTIISKKLFQLFLQNSIRGHVDINYNTSLHILEIANNDKIKGIHLNNYGFYNCTITGIIKNAIVKSCIFNKSAIYNSNIESSNFTDSKIYDSVAKNCEFNNVYVSNPDTLNTYISGNFNSGVIALSNVIRNNFYIDEEAQKQDLIKIIKIIKIDL